MEECIEHKVGRNVEALRKQQRLSQVDLCLMAGIGRTYLNHIEAGRANVTVRCLSQLADALGVTPIDLLQ